MTLKNYNRYRLIIVILLASLISVFIGQGNYILPIIIAALAALILYNLRQHIDGVFADECDYALAGKAARYTLTATGIALMIAFFLLMQFAGGNTELYNLASILSYLACIILLLNAAIFQFLKMKLAGKSARDDKKIKARSILMYLLFAFFAAFLVVSSIRLFSGEDSWICRDGQWIEHGHPSAPRPQTECQKNYEE